MTLMMAPENLPEAAGVSAFDDVLSPPDENLEFTAVPAFATLNEDERAQVAKAVEPFEESRRSAKRRGAGTLYQ